MSRVCVTVSLCPGEPRAAFLTWTTARQPALLWLGFWSPGSTFSPRDKWRQVSLQAQGGGCAVASRGRSRHGKAGVRPA